MEYFVAKKGASPSFAQSTLVLVTRSLHPERHRADSPRNLQPQPSLASLPQLAADLLIHTLNLELVGYLGLQDFIPAVSGLDSATDAPEEGICFGVEGALSIIKGCSVA